jgi:ABC-type transport system involved in cytochrome bd biosynthesis fused ATPase/permease subunit
MAAFGNNYYTLNSLFTSLLPSRLFCFVFFVVLMSFLSFIFARSITSCFLRRLIWPFVLLLATSSMLFLKSILDIQKNQQVVRRAMEYIALASQSLQQLLVQKTPLRLENKQRGNLGLETATAP